MLMRDQTLDIISIVDCIDLVSKSGDMIRKVHLQSAARNPPAFPDADANSTGEDSTRCIDSPGTDWER